MRENREFSLQTPLGCQRALAKEIERLTSDMLFQNAEEPHDLVKLKVYEQSIPIKDSTAETDAGGTEEDTIEFDQGDVADGVIKCPWCTVKIEKGYQEGPDQKQYVKVNIVFGIYNNSLDNNGHYEALNLIERLMVRFGKDPLLDHQYECTGAFNWELNEEDTFPFTFAFLSTEFRFRGVMKRESRFL